MLIQVHSENHKSVCQTDAPLPKDAVSLGHVFTSLDLLTKASYSDEGFQHPACVSLNRLRMYTKIWKARILVQQYSYSYMFRSHWVVIRLAFRIHYKKYTQLNA